MVVGRTGEWRGRAVEVLCEQLLVREHVPRSAAYHRNLAGKHASIRRRDLDKAGGDTEDLADLKANPPGEPRRRDGRGVFYERGSTAQTLAQP